MEERARADYRQGADFQGHSDDGLFQGVLAVPGAQWLRRVQLGEPSATEQLASCLKVRFPALKIWPPSCYAVASAAVPEMRHSWEERVDILIGRGVSPTQPTTMQIVGWLPSRGTRPTINGY